MVKETNEMFVCEGESVSMRLLTGITQANKKQGETGNLSAQSSWENRQENKKT